MVIPVAVRAARGKGGKKRAAVEAPEAEVEVESESSDAPSEGSDSDNESDDDGIGASLRRNLAEQNASRTARAAARG
jgi:hypothetical protein